MIAIGDITGICQKGDATAFKEDDSNSDSAKGKVRDGHHTQ
jgi:hypothetical protein